MMWDLLERGGAVMWPLLVLSFVALTFIIERFVFYSRQQGRRKPRYIKAVLGNLERGRTERAMALAGRGEQDFVVRTLLHGLKHRRFSMTQALEAKALEELRAMKKNLSVLDTIITAAPMLGILGTVLGIIASFHILGDQGISDPMAVTKGISEALITTAYGLIVALVTLIPFNYFRSICEQSAEELENTCSTLEIIVDKISKPSESSEAYLS